MSGFIENLAKLRRNHLEKAVQREKKERKYQQEEQLYERHQKRLDELQDKVNRKFTRQILSEINQGYLGNKGKIYLDGEITIRTERCDWGHKLSPDQTISGNFIVWDKQGDPNNGSLSFYKLEEFEISPLIPEGTDIFDPKVEKQLLGDYSKDAWNEKVLNDLATRGGSSKSWTTRKHRSNEMSDGSWMGE